MSDAIVPEIVGKPMMSQKAPERVPTGITGLDDLIEGGFVRGSRVLVCGGPGMGKTIFCVQFLLNGALNYHEPGVYVTLDESPVSMANYMLRFGWNLWDLVKKEKLSIIDAAPVSHEPMFRPEPASGGWGLKMGTYDFKASSLANLINEHVKSIQAKRIAIDSLSPLLLQYHDDFDRRLEFSRLMRGAGDNDCTILSSSEIPMHSLSREFYAQTFTADGVILLQLIPSGSKATRALQILKMRGTRHDDEFHPYQITDKGIVVSPKERIPIEDVYKLE